MAQPETAPPSLPTVPSKTNCLRPFLALLLLVAGPVIVSVILYQPEGYHPAPLPADHSFAPSVAVPEHHDRVLAVSKRVGDGRLPGPEDLAYDAKEGTLYTGCGDGWLRRVKLTDAEPTVEEWAYTGGRPLGVALAAGGTLVVADTEKGLLMVKPERTVVPLTGEAEGLKFGLTDGVDVASDGLIYFTDASYKYSFAMHMLDIFEGRPHGRLMSFDPRSNQTVVLARDLYFANGVSLSPDQGSLIFCETPLRRCKRYHLEGERKGTIDIFIENLPGFPDNIRYDGDGRYWIGLSAGRTPVWDMLLKHPLLRKMMPVIGKLVAVSRFLRDSGVLSVSLDGEPISRYSDPSLFLVTGGLKIGKHLFYGSLHEAYISRIDLTQLVASTN